MSDKHATIARKSTLILAVKLAVTVASSVAIFLVARYMGDDVLGMIGFATGLAGMFLLTDFGFGFAHNKRISEGQDVGECIGAYLRIKIIITICAVTALLAGLFIWEQVLGHGYENQNIKPVIYIIILYFVLFAFAQIPIQTFGGLRQTAKQQLPELLGTFARVPIMIAAALMGLGVIVLALSYVVTGVVMVIVSLFFFRKFRSKRPSRELTGSYVAFAMPMAVYVLSTTIILDVDKVVLGIFWNYAEVGNFFIMQKIILIIITIASSMGPIMYPSISYHHSKKNFKLVRHIIRRAERYLSMIITPIITMIIALSIPMINIFLTEGYIPGRMTLVWLSIYALILSLNAPYIHLLVGCGKTIHMAKIGLTVLLSNTIILFILVPDNLMGVKMAGLGSAGAAMSSVLALLLGTVMARRISWRIARVGTIRKIYRHWIAGLVSGAFVYYISLDYWKINQFPEFITISAFGLALYLGVMALLKEFGKRELFFFLDLLNARKMFSYVRGELRE